MKNLAGGAKTVTESGEKFKNADSSQLKSFNFFLFSEQNASQRVEQRRPVQRSHQNPAEAGRRRPLSGQVPLPYVLHSAVSQTLVYARSCLTLTLIFYLLPSLQVKMWCCTSPRWSPNWRLGLRKAAQTQAPSKGREERRARRRRSRGFYFKIFFFFFFGKDFQAFGFKLGCLLEDGLDLHELCLERPGHNLRDVPREHACWKLSLPFHTFVFFMISESQRLNKWTHRRDDSRRDVLFDWIVFLKSPDERCSPLRHGGDRVFGIINILF